MVCEHPDQNFTRLQDLTPSMLGTSSAPKLGTRGAETWGLFNFCVELTRRYSTRLADEAHAWRVAGEAMIRYMALLKSEPGVLSMEAIQEPNFWSHYE